MTPEERRYRDLFMAELWPTVHEVPREERALERARVEAWRDVEVPREPAR